MNKQELYPCKDSWKSENTWQTVALSEAVSLQLPVVVHKEKLKSPRVSQAPKCWRQWKQIYSVLALELHSIKPSHAYQWINGARGWERGQIGGPAEMCALQARLTFFLEHAQLARLVIRNPVWQICVLKLSYEYLPAWICAKEAVFSLCQTKQYYNQHSKLSKILFCSKNECPSNWDLLWNSSYKIIVV